MKAIRKTASALAAASVIAMGVTSEQASAVPAAYTHALAVNSGSEVSKVYWRHGWGLPFWGGPAIVGGVILGGALVASAVAERRADRVAMQHCADDFPSFNWRTGTFLNRRGEERVCPYLY